MLIGLTPFAPLGTIATLIAVVLQPSPLWKPANPKRFAWGESLIHCIYLTYVVYPVHFMNWSHLILQFSSCLPSLSEVGLMLASTCFIIVQLKDKISEDSFRATVVAIALTCNLFTWLESAAGFCVCCFVYNNVLVKYFGKEECKEASYERRGCSQSSFNEPES